MMYDHNPTIEHLLAKQQVAEHRQGEAYTPTDSQPTNGKRFYIESYGCQMNFSDSEIVASILGNIGFTATRQMEEADLILINTCSIREKAEETVRKRLRLFQSIKSQRPDLLVGVLGCMAERLKSKFLEEEHLVDMVVGPDAYRDLPQLVATAHEGHKAINVFLSREETYADINPIRLDTNGVSAFISIMRGCDNMCSFCVVPFTRGRERSRDLHSIVAEATNLYQRGYREVTLLGQNVDSYKWAQPDTNTTINFAQLLEAVAQIAPDLRVRFSTSHPKDMTDDVLHTMARHHNICKYIHLPVQSGSTAVLERMNRTYTREWYIERIQAVRRILPDCAISSDIIAGFCGETEADHRDTLSIMEYSDYSMCYMFAYSERPGTLAARKYPDDVPDDIKKQRLNEIIRLQNHLSLQNNRRDIGRTFEVLIERTSTKSESDLCGRNSQNKMVVFPRRPDLQPGQYVQVHITDATSATLLGQVLTTHSQP